MRSFVLTLAAALCLGHSFVPPVIAAQPSAQVVHATPAWPHQVVQRQPDPRVLFGVLPNGMRYALLHNETPKDGVSMRLRIGSGSLQEKDDEQGLAHVLEHMAFRGSRNLADGDVVRMLERQGLRFGADTNAYTAFDQTVYTFDFPRANAESLQTGFTLLREIGEHLTLSQDLLDVERKVVLAEERVRDTPARRTSQASTAHALAGTRIPQRWPIGLTSVIANATSEQLRRFYKDNYRPDNATLIVVGAIDVQAVAQQIEQTFASWQAHGYQAPEPRGQVLPRTDKIAAVQVYSEAGVPENLSLQWQRPWTAKQPTEATERDDVVTQLALDVLNNRLQERALQAGSPYLSAGAYYQGDVLQVAQFSALSISAAPARWAEALQTVVQVQKQLLFEGVRPDELQRVRTNLLTTLQKLVGQHATRASASLANELLQTAHNGTVFTSAAQDLALAKDLLAQLTPQQLTERLRSLFNGAPLAFQSTEQSTASRAALADAVSQAWAQSVQNTSNAAQAVVWPFGNWSHLGAPGKVATQKTDAELGATFITFDNGTRLVLKPTKQEIGNVQVRVSFGQGRAGMQPDQAAALWALPFFSMGGTQRMGLADLQRWTQTQGKSLRIGGLTAAYRSFSLLGNAQKAQLREQLELMTAYLREPGWRPELFDKMDQAGPIAAAQIPTQANIVFMREVERVALGNDPRLLSNSTEAQLRTPPTVDALRPLLASAQHEALDVVLVGDFDPEQATALVAQTLAAGQWQAPTPATPLKAQALPTSATPYAVQHQGRADQGYTGLLWPLQAPGPVGDANTQQWQATADLTAAMLRARLIDTVRESMGLSYSPQTYIENEPDYGYFVSFIETQPQHFAAFAQTVQQVLQRMAQGDISADALDRARRPMLERMDKAQENNGYWVSTLMRVLRQSSYRSTALHEKERLQAVTVADVQAFIQAQLQPGQVRVVQAVREDGNGGGK
ncbi:insulinase family protein [Curvibacter sp. CHRR-16]|uniref:M16 family metallopeptidase n=1 Tax=Curvibacter sp. CHRR-16 TaxID=2835872 RepID=UPI001BD95CAC|nr:insulinase family protein [Curvibacter sp. CHRR-16]MBT0570690.1 insulinase family protein [Curvibacter sp. CHRR-16]